MSTTMPRKKDKAVSCHIRYMIRRDMPSVLAIEELSYETGWTEETFIRHFAQRDTIGMIVELDEEVIGFMVYELHKQRLQVVNLAVHPKFRRMGIGRQMIEKLVGKLSYQRRNRIEIGVADYHLGAHLFLKACGLRAEKMNFDEQTRQDWYHFVYRAKKES